MSEIHPNNSDEIDLLETLQTLWAGKWKIIAITFIATVTGVVFSFSKPNSFEISTPIQNGKQSVFLKYIAINDLLKNAEMLYNKDDNPSGYIINSDSIFKTFVFEFNDYKEIAKVLSTSDFIQKIMDDLEDNEKQKVLIDFAKSFKLKAPSNNLENWVLSFEWHDDLEGLRLLNDAIRQTLLKVRNVTKSDIENLAQAIESRNSRALESLRNDLSVIVQNQILSDNKRIQYLTEQSLIAAELGYATNTLDSNSLFRSPPDINLSGGSWNEPPYYLRGYKAIDKEILIIRGRSEEAKSLVAKGYLETSEKILSLERNLSSSQLRKASKMIANDNINEWIEFDLALSNVKSLKNSRQLVALFIVLGGMVGAIYVLISNVFRKRRAQLAEA